MNSTKIIFKSLTFPLKMDFFLVRWIYVTLEMKITHFKGWYCHKQSMCLILGFLNYFYKSVFVLFNQRCFKLSLKPRFFRFHYAFWLKSLWLFDSKWSFKNLNQRSKYLNMEFLHFLVERVSKLISFAWKLFIRNCMLLEVLVSDWSSLLWFFVYKILFLQISSNAHIKIQINSTFNHSFS